ILGSFVSLGLLGAMFHDGTSRSAISAENPSNVIHVAPGGDDSGNGTAESPVASLRRAVDLVREKRQQLGAEPDIRVVLEPGVYRLREPILLGPAECPGPGALIISTDGPEPAIISGGRPLTGWRESEGRWTTQADSSTGERRSFRELFVNGRRAIRARTPNEGFRRVVRAGEDRRTSLFIDADDAPLFSGDLSQAEFVYFHDWSTSRVKIAGFDPRTLEVRFSQVVGCSAPHYAICHWPHPRYYLENGRDMLDSPGEWLLDESSGEVSYIPLPGEKLSEIEAIVPEATALLVVSGDLAAGKPVRNLVVEGITFAHCRWDLPEAGYASGQASVYEPRLPGRPGRELLPAAVTLDYAEKCVFRNCRFTQLGASGLWLRRQVRNCGVERCEFTDISGNGVNIGETVTRPIADAGPAWSSPYGNACSFGNRVADSVVVQCGKQFYEAVGIWIGLSPGNIVEHNEVAELPYTGISVGWSWNDSLTGCRDNRIAANHIHHCMLVLHDGGGIYTLGRQPGTVLEANLIHDIPPNEDGAESNGIFMDEGSSDILVTRQTIYGTGRSPIRFHRALEVTLRGNRLVCLPGVPPFRYNRTDPATLVFE
ncbi:MAG: right-handed parallel beta-helix repeat-containing protein, partial [Thermogutta sp.]|nr:right-handed parallel beta-helix repeat-containing protein [Thermogutta sp.]